MIAILALCVLQWFYYEPASAHNGGVTPSDCVDFKIGYDRAQQAVVDAAEAIDLFTENAVWTMVVHCIIAGAIAGGITMVGAGLLNIPTGAAAFTAAGSYCIGTIAVTLTTSIPGYSAAITKLNRAKERRDAAKAAYDLCVRLYNDFYDPPKYKNVLKRTIQVNTNTEV